MGLDIAFNRNEAIKAGLVIVKEVRGTPEMIQSAEECGESQSFIDYLSEEGEYIKVPNTNIMVANDGVDEIVVRANKWGRTYAPLTQWLKEHSIEWSEF